MPDLRSLRLPTVVLLLAACGAAAGADSATVAAARTLHAQAVKAGRIWTALQLESWARAQGVALPPVLGRGSMVIGEPRLAFAGRIAQVTDRHELLAVCVDDQAHLLAADGRPLALPAAYPPRADEAKLPGADPEPLAPGVSDDAAWIATGMLQTAMRCDVAVHRAGDPAPAWSTTLLGEPGERLAHPLRVAADGSAVALATLTSEEASGRLVIQVRGRPAQGVPHLHRPLAIGPGAAWVAALSSRDGRLRVRLGDGGWRPAEAAVEHAGRLAMTTPEGALWLVDPRGATAALAAGMGLGARAQLRSHAGWLAVTSSDDALTQPGRDALDRPVGGGDPQPRSTALWRWSELLRSASAAPAQIVRGRVAPAHLLPGRFLRAEGGMAALFAPGRDGELVLVAQGPEVEHIGLAPTGRHLLIQTAADHGHRWRLLDAEGRLCLDAVADQVDWAGGTWLLLRRNDGRMRLAIVHPDPGQRRVVELTLPATMDTAAVESAGVVVCWRDEVWTVLDPATGRELPEERRPARRPPLPPEARSPAESIQPEWIGGSAHPHRLRPRLAIATGPAATAAPISDAWSDGSAALTVDEDGAVAALARPGATPAALGMLPRRGAWRFGLHARQLALGQDDAGISAIIGPGPALTIAPMPDARLADLPDPLAVRGDDGQFTWRGGWHWDAGRAGFTPTRLRGADGQRLVSVTPAAVLVIDPAAMPLVASQARRR